MPKFTKNPPIQPPQDAEESAMAAIETAEDMIAKMKDATEKFHAGDKTGAAEVLAQIKKETDESPFMQEQRKFDELLRQQKLGNYAVFALTGIALAGLATGIYFHFQGYKDSGSKNGESSGMTSFV